MDKGTKAISDMPTPKNASGIKRFLGLVGYFWDYVPNLSLRSANLRSLLRKEVKFSWSEQHEQEFQDLKQAIISSKVMLYHPNWNAPFEVHTDASKIGCGAMLAQNVNGQLRPVRYASRSFTVTESRWPTMHQELFAVKWALEQFRPYVLGRQIKIITDHANLKWLSSIAPSQSKLARWCLAMAEFDFTIEHRPGKCNVVPDTLSRAPLVHPETLGEDLVDLPASVLALQAILLGFDLETLEPTRTKLVLDRNFQILCLACSLSEDSHDIPALESVLNSSIANTQPQPAAKILHTPLTRCSNAPVSASHPLNFSRAEFLQKQLADPLLSHLYNFLASSQDTSVLSSLSRKQRNWVITNAKRTKLVDGLLMYSDEFMDDPHHLRIYVPSDIALQRHLLQAYHDSPMGMHRGHDATYSTLSRDFFWRNLAKHVQNWIRRCPDCIRFKTTKPAHGPMVVRLFQHPFHTLGVDYVGELPLSPSQNKWILTAVCPYSNFLRALPVPDKTAPTAAKVLFHEVFLPFGFPVVLQSDRGGEWMNALLHCLAKLLSIKQVFTSSFRPRTNGATERVHRFLNAALGICCEHKQEKWEEYLQPAVYSHNVSPIAGTQDITPFFLVFGREAKSPETVSLELPAHPLPAEVYAQDLTKRLAEAHKEFGRIKADLRRYQRDYYDSNARILTIPDGKIVYMRKDHSPSQKGLATCFIRNFEGPLLVTGHQNGRPDLLKLRNLATGQDHPNPVNIEKLVVAPEPDPTDLRIDIESATQSDGIDEGSTAERAPVSSSHSELAQVAMEFGKYLLSLPSHSSIASEACKYVYLQYPPSREVLARHGKLRGLVKACSYLQIDGAVSGGTYVISLNLDKFMQVYNAKQS